jgi:tetratricopeptide (TPR) repeat protein
MKDLFAIQDEIARSIVETLRGKNAAEGSYGLAKPYTQDLEVYNLYLKGRYFWDKLDGEKARSYFEQAIAKDPGYAPAYAGIAQYYQRFAAKFTPRESQAKKKEFAEKALELDPELAEAHAVLEIWSCYEYDWQAAESRFLRAIKLNPNFYLAHQWYGHMLLPALGRMSEAIREMKRAEELNPLSADVAAVVSDVLRKAGRFDEALVQARKAVELDPNSIRAHGFLGQAYLDKRMYAEGIREMEICCATRWAVAYAYAVAGRRSDAMRILHQVLEQSRPTDLSPGFIAQVYAALGDKDRAFEWLESAYKDHDLNLSQAFTLTEFAGVRADPRYKALRQKLSLPQQR